MDTLESKIKNSYMIMLKSGILLEYYPELTGDWDEDQDFWYEEYLEQMEAMKNR